MKNAQKYYRNTPNRPRLKGLRLKTAQLFRKTDSSRSIPTRIITLFTFRRFEWEVGNFIGISEYLSELRKNQIVKRSDVSNIIGIKSESLKIIGI